MRDKNKIKEAWQALQLGNTALDLNLLFAKGEAERVGEVVETQNAGLRRGQPGQRHSHASLHTSLEEYCSPVYINHGLAICVTGV